MLWHIIYPLISINVQENKSKAEKKEEEEVKPVKEVPIQDSETKHASESGCIIS